MEILAIDTATKCSGAAIADEMGIKAQFSLNVGLTHSQTFLPMVNSLLESAGLSLEDMSAIAVTVGPGSFTGLRIGLSTAKAWGQALGLPLIAVGTLEALDAAAGSEGFVCPVLDARKNEVYCGLFKNGIRVWEDRAITPAQLVADLQKIEGKITFIGDGLCNLFYEEQVLSGIDFQEAGEISFVTAACGAAIIGRRIFAEGNFYEPSQIEPVYLRLSEAESRKLQAKERSQ